ncbi:integrase arm-type DNA-binding domain-containing protein, partial [Citrobacter freundii]|uniref:integrase arm-type DNA-binding domain-containing protein n=1 Tax=Citrobacter freundii TaxID=546 RepID=UPI0029DA0156|nr:hypothetical protein [Citrobacter freundii]
MAKIAKKLTDTEIKSTKPADKEINLFDGDGLILRIAPLSKGGKKNWYFRYAVPVSKKRTKMCSGQLKLATALEFFQYRFSDSFGG